MQAHADYKTLREGVTFVIDTSGRDAEQKFGNERKMQVCVTCWHLSCVYVYVYACSVCVVLEQKFGSERKMQVCSVYVVYM